MTKIKLAELPHFVLQGEGSTITRKYLLVRVYGCDLHCPECDSAHTWDTCVQEYSMEEFEQAISFKIKEFPNVNRILFTGGAPSLYKDFILEFSKRNQYWIEIEDAGNNVWPIIPDGSQRIHFNFSPKIAGLPSADPKEWSGIKDIVERFSFLGCSYIIKIVVDAFNIEQDLIKVQEFIEQYTIPKDSIYLMPKGYTREEIIKQSPIVIEACFKNNYNFSPRLHTLIFDNRRLV